MDIPHTHTHTPTHTPTHTHTYTPLSRMVMDITHTSAQVVLDRRRGSDIIIPQPRCLVAAQGVAE